MFQHEVGDIYDAENRFLKGQQEMLDKASDPQLQGLIRQHIEQTQQHIKNLDQVFSLLGQQPKGVTCDSAQGLVAEAQKAMQDAASDPIRDVLIDTAADKVEHYEIASYRGLITDAVLMGQTEIQNLLQQKEQTAQLLEQAAPQLVRKALQSAGIAGGTLSGTAAGAPMTGQGMATETPLTGLGTMATEPPTVTGESAMTEPRSLGAGQVRPGMAVVGSDASQVGQVKEVRDADFLVDRRGRRDVFVPVDAIQEITGDRIMLNLPADQVDDMNWEKPPLI
jgi:ferritin-like metal-binding protein YciE